MPASKVQAGASLCTWKKATMSCEMRNPPVDPVFTILVAIMTIILSIPMIIILTSVLEHPASRWPGMNAANELDSALEKADQDNQKEEEFKKEQALKEAEKIEDGEEGEEVEEGEGIKVKAPEFTDDVYQSQFGLLLNSGILRGSLGVVNSPSETIYTGQILLCLLFAHAVITYSFHSLYISLFSTLHSTPLYSSLTHLTYSLQFTALNFFHLIFMSSMKLYHLLKIPSNLLSANSLIHITSLLHYRFLGATGGGRSDNGQDPPLSCRIPSN